MAISLLISETRYDHRADFPSKAVAEELFSKARFACGRELRWRCCFLNDVRTAAKACIASSLGTIVAPISTVA